jgi:lysophospholipase
MFLSILTVLVAIAAGILPSDGNPDDLGVVGSSPNGTYAPGIVTCPAFNLTRQASTGLSQNETNWLRLRRPNIITALESWLPQALSNVPNNTFNISAYISALRANNSQVPIAGLALSGGGARATLSGFGAWQAFDNRYPPAVAAGLRGIAQALTYLSGLSGGGNPTGGIAMSNYSTLQQLMSYGTETANLSGSAINTMKSTLETQIATGFLQQIGLKAQQGFNVSASDFFSFVLGEKFLFNQSIAGVDVPIFGRTWSDIQGYGGFSLGLYPMPIVMANEVVPPGIPNVTEFFGALLPAYNSSNNTIVFSQQR